jgi:hypothetical protein
MKMQKHFSKHLECELLLPATDECNILLDKSEDG